MYKNLIESAKSEGIASIVVEVVVQKENQKILLIEDLKKEKPFFELPNTKLKEKETLPQAIQRVVTEKTSMHLKEVTAYLGYRDKEKERHYYFAAKVEDPYSLEGARKIIYTWLDLQEAFGYPLSIQTREILSFYAKF